ncbi:MAG TPA: ABC transporter permease [Gemmatimonadaceae bacterium]|nr:ABC transporter permease [Gemmatimonadaceae bacterium]
MSTESRTPAWRRYLSFWGTNHRADVDDELRFHFEMRVREYVARGMSRADAERVAMARLGNIQRAAEEAVTIDQQHARRMDRLAVLRAIRQDAAFASRLLRRDWLATTLALVCLALGIGATTTMFSVANALLLRPMPFPNGDRLYVASVREHSGRDAGSASYPDFLDWSARQHSFESLAALAYVDFVIPLRNPTRAAGALVSANYFQTLGVTALRGRLFAAGEDADGASPVAIVSRGFAERELGGVDRAVGASIDIHDVSRKIVGVVPDGLALPATGEVWLPVPRDLDHRRGERNLEVIGLIRPNVTLDRARADLAGIESQLAVEYPSADAGLSATAWPLRDQYVGSARSTLVALILATVLVLLVACANVAAMQIARATSRIREIAVRCAIGANRSRVFRQLLTESVLLSIAGGVAGVALAYRFAALAGRSVVGVAPRWMIPSIDPRVLAFGVGISVLTGVVFGVAPAMRLTRVDPADALRGGRGVVGPSRGRLQRALVFAQIALSIVLLVAAGLSIESVRKVEHIPLGFDPGHVLVFHMSLADPHYNATGARARFLTELAEAAESLPGVDAAGAVEVQPLGCCSQWGIVVHGREDETRHFMVTGSPVTPDYFRSMRISLLAGRNFRNEDGPTAPQVIIINKTFADRFWPNGDAIGHIVSAEGAEQAEIIGVVNDVKQASMLDAPEPQFYRPFTQMPTTHTAFAIRVRDGDPTRIVPELRRAVHDLDPALAIFNISPMQTLVENAMLARRTFESLMIACGVVALLLASIGVFAVTSFFVAQRTQELGVRSALGAEPMRLARYVLRGTMLVALVGVIAGTSGAYAAAAWLAHSLYGVTAREPIIYLAAIGVLVTASLLATVGPARRASTADPMAALRAD